MQHERAASQLSLSDSAAAFRSHGTIVVGLVTLRVTATLKVSPMSCGLFDVVEHRLGMFSEVTPSRRVAFQELDAMVHSWHDLL
jgi:hypothetical protein